MTRRVTEKGKSVMLFLNGKAIALATSSDLEYNRTTEDAATKDDAGASHYEAVGEDWSITSNSLVGVKQTDGKDFSFDDLFALCKEGTTIPVLYGATASAESEVPATGWTVPTSGLTGNAIIEKITRNDSVKQNSTMTVGLKGQGTLSQITAP